MTEPQTRTGLIIRAQSGFFTVLAEETGQTVTCQLRGRLKQGPRLGDIAAVGDVVRFSTLPDGSGIIEEILPRKREIVRMDSRARKANTARFCSPTRTRPCSSLPAPTPPRACECSTVFW